MAPDAKKQPIAAHKQRSIAYTIAGTLILMLAAGSLFLVAAQLSGFFKLDEISYGDSAVLYNVRLFQKTGQIYHDPSQPPYVPTVYSPLAYMIFALPQWNTLGNPFFWPRLAALAAFLLCVATVVSIVRVLIPVRFAWLWGLLAATSIVPMSNWVLQLRCDFAAAFFGLAAIRLLLSRSRHAVLLAGVCAGIAPEFKVVYIAALAAGSCWLLLRKRVRDLFVFAAAGTLTSACLYFLFWLREPRMFAHILMFGSNVRDVAGCMSRILHAGNTLAVPLALIALPRILRRAWPRWMLLLLYAGISLAIAALAEFQPGANINYFFEGLLAIVPLSVFGVLQLLAWGRTRPILAVLLSSSIVILFLFEKPNAYVPLPESPSAVRSSNDLLRKTAGALRGVHIFSTVSRLALLDSEPALMEPFGFAYLRRIGKLNGQPVFDRIRAGEFDVLITAKANTTYRGIHFVDRPFRAVISAAYKPYCTIAGNVFYLPLSRQRDDGLIQRLDGIGCRPYASEDLSTPGSLRGMKPKS